MDNEKLTALESVKISSYMLNQLPVKYRQDREVVLEAVKSFGESLIWAWDGMQNDKEIVLAAINNNPEAIRYASPNMRNDTDIGKVIVDKDPNLFVWLGKKNRSNLDICLEAVTKCPKNYKNICENFKYEDYFIKLGLNDSSIYHDLSDINKNNPEYCLIAARSNPKIYQYFPQEIKEVCSKEDPVKTLESYLLSVKLNDSLKSNRVSSKKKIKL